MLTWHAPCPGARSTLPLTELPHSCSAARSILTREIDEIVLLLGVAAVAASKRFYLDHGFAVVSRMVCEIAAGVLLSADIGSDTRPTGRRRGGGAS